MRNFLGLFGFWLNGWCAVYFWLNGSGDLFREAEVEARGLGFALEKRKVRPLRKKTSLGK